MRLLVLGGTVFLGRAVARQALAAGHDVTCAARGESGEPPPGATFLRIDRVAPDGYSALRGERYDAVVDVARRPSHVRSALTELADRVGHWVFVSTASVYAETATPDLPVEATPLLPPAPAGEDLDDQAGGPEAYGSNKVSCEQAVTSAFGADRSMLCRAGLVIGPEDGTGRFEYWVRRMARGGEVLAPGSPADRVQFVDVRDLAAWLIDAARTGLAGTYNGIGAPMSRADFLAGVAAGVGGTPTLTWVDQEFLIANEVRPWSGERSLPLWLPLPEYAGFMTRDASAALAAGLRPRPLATTAADTLEWLADKPDATDRCGLRAADEADLLARWRNRDG